MFTNRQEAGRKLAGKLIEYKDQNPFVLAIPRGGVVVAYEVSLKLHAPLDVIVVRKVGHPQNLEFGIGAIAEENVFVLDRDTIHALNIPRDKIDTVIEKENKELERRVLLYRKGRPLLSLKGKTAIVVDDGIATGVSAQAAIEAVYKLKPKHLVFACPACSKETVDKMRKKVDDFICLEASFDFGAVGSFYQNFPQISDEEVIEILEKARKSSQFI